MSRRSSVGRKDATRLRIEQMEAERQERRRAMQERRNQKLAEEERQRALGNGDVDVDFVGLVQEWRDSREIEGVSLDSSMEEEHKICICVRKRPVSDKERQKKDHDSITCLHPTVTVHAAKLKVDGITKYLDHSSFQFDYAFDETVSTDQVYLHSTMPLIDFVCTGSGGRATVFAYGQTGSGKTYTMEGIQELVAQDLFETLKSKRFECHTGNTEVAVAFFEIYGGFIQDLLNERRRLKVLEDSEGEINVTGLEFFAANDPAELLQLVANGNRCRTTHSTEANDTSSRSHAICQIVLRGTDSGRLLGKLSLVDLAGSERGTDTKSHNRQRRNESAEINTSLLALKECIRALGCHKTNNNNGHVPYRASKLTLILKDCFTSSQARTTMIATVSPGASSADHTLNTLRYADRIKEQKVGSKSSKFKSQNIENKAPTTDQAEDKLPEKGRTGVLTNSNDETELELAVQRVFEEEEDLLNTHMSHISESAQLLTEEGKMLQTIQQESVTEEQIEDYVRRLEEIIERKTQLIEDLDEKMASFRQSLKVEEELSSKLVR